MAEGAVEPTEMELRVQEALAFAYNEHDPESPDSDLFEDLARAAIRAMREPTEGMESAASDAAEKHNGRFYWCPPDVIWRAMIDVASPTAHALGQTDNRPPSPK